LASKRLRHSAWVVIRIDSYVLEFLVLKMLEHPRQVLKRWSINNSKSKMKKEKQGGA
jgi:hypothetical protein